MISLKSYRRAAVPLLAIHTADPAEVLQLAIDESENGSSAPVLRWDCVHGLFGVNAMGIALAGTLNNGGDPAMTTSNPAEALRAVESIRDDTIADRAVFVMLGMGEIMNDPTAGIAVRQAVWNLRDVLTVRGALLVLTVPMGWRNPFPDDITVQIAPLPTPEELAATVNRIVSDAGLESAAETEVNAACDALRGLSSFAAEQTLALSLTKKDGINIESLWARKRQQISETPGLSVYAGKETFEDLGGLDQAKKLFASLLNGKRRIGAVAFIDEGEKAFAGSARDTSGVAQDQLGCLLSYMQDNNAIGAIFVGPPGAAKSAFAKAIGNEGKVPTVTLDLGGLKGSLVGESEARMRKALAVITSISGGRPFFVMTCNSISILPPELRRRFTLGTMFFDLPSAEERKAIWAIYCTKYEIPNKQKFPNSEGWTGAEIKQCCDLADRLGISLLEAAKYIVPVAVSAREKIGQLRQEASGRYLSASNDGIFTCTTTVVKSRNINLE